MSDRVKNIVLIILIISIFGYCYYFFYLKDEMIKITKTRMDISTKATQVTELISKRNIIDNEIASAKLAGRQLEEQFPDVYDKKEMILHFYNMIKTGGVTSDKITFSDAPKEGQPYRICSVNFTATSDYATIMRLVRTVENDQRKFVIKQASINPGEKGTSLNILIEFYSLQ